MKAIVLYACAIVILASCQKEVLLPQNVKEDPHQVVVPEPEPEPEPEPAPSLDPPPGTISESVYLRNLPLVFNSSSHYKLSKIYTESSNLWLKTPSWTKDDIHTFEDSGTGSIESTSESCPDHPFTNLEQGWTAYAESDGVKLSWVDLKYAPTVYTLVYAVPGEMFKAFRIVNGTKIFYEFAIVAAAK